MDTLPDEMLVHVMQFLSGDDLVNCMWTSRRWRTIVQSTSSLWTRDENLKAVGQGYQYDDLLDVISLIPTVRFLDIQEDPTWNESKCSVLIVKILSDLRDVEKIRLFDPTLLIDHFSDLFVLPKLQRVSVILHGLENREHRISRLRHKRLISSLDYVRANVNASFVSHILINWDRKPNGYFEPSLDLYRCEMRSTRKEGIWRHFDIIPNIQRATK